MASLKDVLLCGLGVLAVYSSYRLLRNHMRRKGLQYPPGPSGLPLVGNIRPPAAPSWETYRAWSKQYGSDVIYLNALGNDIVILNSMQAARDLLDKRSAIYSDRPASGMTMLGELCGLSWTFAVQQYGTEWFRPTEIAQARKLLLRLLLTPQDLVAHVRLMTGSSSLSIAYGIETNEGEDPYIVHAETTMEAVNESLKPRAFLIDLFPILKYVPEWFPGAGFKTKARLWKRPALWSLNKPWEVAKERMLTEPYGGPDSAAESLIQDDAKDPDYMEVLLNRHSGRSTLTLSILKSFFLAMVLHPDIQRRAQGFIDDVCRGKLPDFDDYDSLLYIHAIVKECLRWHPVLALNVPHSVSEADVYKGYYIPKGSVVIVNNWALLHDPEAYSHPEAFIPELFLKEDATTNEPLLALDPEVRDPMEVAFGFGRRICPGRFMAYESMWITIASILATFNIEKAQGEDGKEITPSEAYCDGFVSRPHPFTCEIFPRSPRHVAVALETEERS